ncbi:hypothetical protein KKI95_18555 [Xenorhabdus bovienii]|uniref:hypothetical protein n=1 Tax=Xenorhabdus bovienii TaxID=40576 RepID=UPI0023B20F81|nr:hypothetical protein [Xenorhabdus bovienii]MDE9437871.1 hypothetical protein [Xenorhabdus bovienii]MDE9499694.1 hypothetical protein [Xenorhabdus bovienii]
MSIWNNFYRLNTLSVSFVNNVSAKNATIFGNGNNQVAILVKVKVSGYNGSQELDIPKDELLKNCSLIKYSTGEKLPFKNNSSWHYTDIENDFNLAISYSNVQGDEPLNKSGVSSIIYYLSASDISDGLDIAVGLNVPGVGEFNTTADGTSTKNGPNGASGSIFKSPSFVHVIARAGINYSRPENIAVNNMPTSFDSFEHIVKDMLVKWGDKPHYVGISSKTNVIITPKESSFKFKKIDIHRNNVSQVFKIAGDGFCDMLWGVGGDNFDTQFIFINKRNYGLSPSNTIRVLSKTGKKWLYHYKIGENDRRHQFSEDVSTGIIKISICNHRIPVNELYHYDREWRNEGSPIKIDVKDTYGNGGTITIKALEQFWPELQVNV